MPNYTDFAMDQASQVLYDNRHSLLKILTSSAILVQEYIQECEQIDQQAKTTIHKKVNQQQ